MIPQEKIDKAATDYASAVFGLGVNMSTYAAFLSGVHFAETEMQNPIIKTKVELGDDLCKYCTLEKKGVYGVGGGYVAGCEGSRCNEAYENYLDIQQKPVHSEIDKYAQNIIAEFVIWISNNRCYPVIFEVGILWYIGRSDISYTYTDIFAKFMAEREVRP